MTQGCLAQTWIVIRGRPAKTALDHDAVTVPGEPVAFRTIDFETLLTAPKNVGVQSKRKRIGIRVKRWRCIPSMVSARVTPHNSPGHGRPRRLMIRKNRTRFQRTHVPEFDRHALAANV